MDIITYAIPFFFVAIGIEAWWSHRERAGLYRLADSITDLSCGILNQLVSVFTAGLIFGVYWFVWDRFSLIEWESGWPVWVAAVLGVDVTYYWFHRMAHEHNVLWVTHSPHHSSEEYNLTVALRQGAIEPLATWPFRLPLAVLGIPPLVFLAANSGHTVYQFFVHTRAVPKLGPLEWIFVTPSHHRVHHGCDPKYLDRNYSGFLIVWDRLFGTFQEEEEAPTYGIVRPVASWNPMWANLEHYRKVREAARGLPWREKLRLWWSGPVVFAAPGGPVETAGRPKYDARVTSWTAVYVLGQFGLGVLATVGLLFAASALAASGQLAVAVFVAATVVSCGAILDGRWWAAPFEGVRLALVPAFAALIFGWGPAAGGVGLVVIVASVGWLVAGRSRARGSGTAA